MRGTLKTHEKFSILGHEIVAMSPPVGSKYEGLHHSQSSQKSDELVSGIVHGAVRGSHICV